MQRVAKFDGEHASDRCDVCWLAIHMGRVLVLNDAQGKQSRDDRRKDLAILRALRAASTEAPDEKTEDGKPKYPKLPTGDAQRMVTPGATLTLQQIEVDRLVALIDRVGWETSKIEAVEDTLDWLASAEKIEG